MKITRLVVSFFLAAVFSARGFGADPLYPGSPGTIVSLLRRGDNVIVCVRGDALFEASVTEKKWRRLASTSPIPGDGILVQQAPDSPLLAYYPRWWDGALSGKDHVGLYVSNDAGETWNQKSAGRVFDGLFIHPDGKFYAFETVGIPHPEKHLGDSPFNADGSLRRDDTSKRLVVSKDQGATWEVLCPEIPETKGMDLAGISMTGIFQDPDHPGQVCLAGRSFTDVAGEEPREFVYQAEDASYEWKGSDLSSWHDGSAAGPGPRDLEAGILDIGYPETGATLSNFFSMPPEIPSETTEQLPVVKTEKAAYTFHKKGPKPVRVSMAFPKDYAGPAPKLLDNKDETVFWGMRACYDFQAGYYPYSCRPPLNSLSWRVKKDDELLHDPELRTVVVDSEHPYERELDLDKFYNFAKPGVYKLRIYHSDSGLVKKSGNAGSDVFDVTIME